MARFAFEARDQDGRVVRGTREAPSQSDLAAALQSRQLSVMGIRLAPGQELVIDPPPVAAPEAAPILPASAAGAALPGAGRRKPVGASGGGGVAVAPPTFEGVGAGRERPNWGLRANSQQMALYFRQMHALLHAGSSLSHALAVSAQYDASSSLRRASEEMSRKLALGTPWSEAMRAYPGLFSDLAVGLVQAGESSGRVDEACARLSSYAERDYHLQQTIKRETWYPKLLVGAAILVPSVVPLVLEGVGAWWASIRVPLFLTVGAIGAWKGLSWASPLFSQARALAYGIDAIKLKLPVAGKVSRGFASAKLCRALGASMGAGVPVNRAMILAASACDNVVLAQSVEKARRKVLEGETLTGALASTGQLPPVAVQMLAVGEGSGQVEQSLEKVAEFLEADAETAVKQAVKLLGVLVFLLVAWRIGSQVVSFYSGFYSGADGIGDVVSGE